MPAPAVVKGLIISISIITALGIAVLENPQVQIWLEEQRRRIAELLRSIGEDLDPESRRQAEAFAFEGKTPATHAGLRREASGSWDAAALATGRTLSGSSSTIRRIPVRGPNDPDEAEERRRKGREYLARRNQQMMELEQKRKASKAEGTTTPTSFDAIVDLEGKLKEEEDDNGRTMLLDKCLPSPPSHEPIPVKVQEEMREVERNLAQPLLAGESSSSMTGFDMGSILANPFSDEFALDRSSTPKPPVPPKVQLDPETQPAPTMPGSYTLHSPTIEPQPEDPIVNHEELTYEEQLAIALSLSEAESSANGATVRQRQPEEQDAELKAAIAASLRDMDDQQAAHAIANAGSVTPQPRPVEAQPLVDLTPPSPHLIPIRQSSRSWQDLFVDQPVSAHEPLAPEQPSAVGDDEDELYRITPQLTRARLASHNAGPSLPSLSSLNLPAYDPVRAVSNNTHAPPPAPEPAMEASFYSAPASPPPPPANPAIDREAAQLGEPVQGPAFESDSDTETFASLSRPASVAPSHARSEISGIEIIDVAEDSDGDMLAGEGSGVLTPDSWSEVGSRDGESEAGDVEQEGRARTHV
ncbi:hypothetical protein LTR53_012455 [Teratosphaeriaceae sp. CCFEE 6253]|nr:hypothetical protein LTR53_012455 [Teratosphaeriaceae sp. CCFEE 6253]